MIEYLMKE
jgi:hypothetical protein